MEEVIRSLGAECPRRIMGELHACGRFEHGTSSRYPGKILCVDRGAAKPAGWAPTEAQLRAKGRRGAMEAVSAVAS